MKYTVSKATNRNWKRLSVDTVDRLKSRANKQKSEKRIIPAEYLTDKKRLAFIKYISETYSNHSIPDIIYEVAKKQIIYEGIENRTEVKTILETFKSSHCISPVNLNETIPKFSTSSDLIGALYQSLLSEGEKNKNGSYYTPLNIVHHMLSSFKFDKHSTFLDPCCGSGAFLIQLNITHPENIFGVERDPIAAFIAKINLILKYKQVVFSPNIFCEDFLQNTPIFDANTKFDFIATNPPWGSKSKITVDYIDSSESFAQFFVKSYNILQKNGEINFLFPESILNVGIHKNIREFILKNQDLIQIRKFSTPFTGVVTKFISMIFKKGKITDKIQIIDNNETFYLNYSAFHLTENQVFSLIKPEEELIIKSVLKKSTYSLKNSQWGLGIVTGNNKEKLATIPQSDFEKIYTGKEIEKYTLKDAKYYILYDRKSFQQVAKDEIYRAKEKLVYKFISNQLMFAYDNSSSLFLNSANMLIPNIPGMSTKTVMAFLNSTLYQFLYQKLFGELKVLKGNLSALPFPKISTIDNENLTVLVDEILAGDNSKQADIDNHIFSLYGLTKEQITHVRININGKTN